MFIGCRGYHQYIVEFLREPLDLERFRSTLDEELSRRNADYLAHRARDVVLLPPAVIAARAGSFESWMRRRGRLGGQNKVPRMDASGLLTRDLVAFLRESGGIEIEVGGPPDAEWAPATGRRSQTPFHSG